MFNEGTDELGGVQSSKRPSRYEPLWLTGVKLRLRRKGGRVAQFLISGPGTLQRLAGKLPGTKPIVAAVAYATRDDHLSLGAGDDITVNAASTTCSQAPPTLR
jgi:hypothetical protein